MLTFTNNPTTTDEVNMNIDFMKRAIWEMAKEKMPANPGAWILKTPYLTTGNHDAKYAYNMALTAAKSHFKAAA